MNWTESASCRSGAHCQACRTDAAFRQSIVRARKAKSESFECPRGIAIADTPEARAGLGTLLEKAISLIPFVKRLPCYDEQGRLKPQSGCAQRRDALNQVSKKSS